MSSFIASPHGVSRRWLALVPIVAMLALADDGIVCASDSTLPRDVVVGLDIVRQHFPDITKEAKTGPNATAVGKTRGTRAVVFTNDDGSAKVTI